MALDEYRRKRDFRRTPEPAGAEAPARPQGSFVVQKHAARRLHYDFRLEMDGVLKSWAVAKGPSLDPGDKRLAVHTEDHPLEYGTFEGIIPKGEYGGGTVLLWDRGQWFPEGDPAEGYRRGVLKFRLEGEKLAGGWALIRLKDRGRRAEDRNWLLVKERDEAAREGGEITDEAPLSVASGRPIEEIAEAPEGVWHSNREGVPDAAAVPGAKSGPLPEFVEPQLATLADEAPEGGDWLHEIKFDGYRALCRIEAGRARFLTRSGLDWTEKFGRPLAAAAAGGIKAGSALVDGEVVVLDANGASDFGLLQEALSDGRGEAMVYFAFDLLHLDGFDLREAALEERKRLLKALLPDTGGAIRYSDHIEGQGPAVRRRACGFALEGVVSKRRDRPYRPGRGRDWIKAKCLNRQEFVIGGFTPPAGQRSGVGALLLGYHRDGGLVYAGRVGTGFTEKTLIDLKKRLSAMRRDTCPFVAPPADRKGVTWVEPQLVAEVEFTNWTREGLLRHASYKGLRLDKPPAEVVREAGPPAARDAKLQHRLDSLQLTNPDKVLYPGQGITKRGLAAYYLEVAEWILPHVAMRPLTLVRCPEGSGGKCFYQRHATAGMSKAIHFVDGGSSSDEPYLYIGDAEGLLALVQMGVLEIHTWGARIDKVECPDRIVFDLDPDPGIPWGRVVEGARLVRERLAGMGLESFVKTTGGKGLHVMVPLERRHGWDEVKAFTKAVVERIAGEAPERYTANMAKAKRQGRIYIDYLRNQRAATFIAAYSTRARHGAPVSVPLAWEELESGIRSDHYTVETILRRLAALGADPWAGLAGRRQSITARMRQAVGLSG